MKARTLVNPGKKKKRKLSPLQKLFFGSKRQRVAAASKKRTNPSKKSKRYSSIKRKVRRVRTVAKQINPSRYRDWETDRKSTRLNSSHSAKSRMPSSA